MNKKVVPTMSIFGFTSDPQVMTEKLFLYFITSEYSQTVTFYGEISSLKYILYQHATEPDELEDLIREQLVILYKKYFPEVDVVVIVKKGKKEGNYIIDISIHTKTSDGIESTVSKTLKTEGSKITNLLDLIYK
jgi:hypothetical protein